MTTTTRTIDNIIGREIYESIKDLTNPQRIEYFENVSSDHKELYKKYDSTLRQQKYKKMKQINRKQMKKLTTRNTKLNAK